MDAPRGSGRGNRGRGRGRGGLAPRVQAQPAPLAVQMRQILRLEEPKEMAVLRRFKNLGATQVRSTYGQTGLLEMEVKLATKWLEHPAVGGASGPLSTYDEGDFVNLPDAELALELVGELAERERALARREVRLPEARRRVSWSGLTPDEKRVLRLSQKEYNSFRTAQGGAGAAAAVNPPPPPPQATPAADEEDEVE